ncbi:MAG TPA: MscL family protein [Acidimicrobiia bacterium]|nr:MscL family protein [Acidimicrobiia bacterium]
MKNTLKEFKDFIAGGNLIDIAVAFIMALYFKDVVDSFINGIVLRFIAAIVGKPSFNDIVINLWSDKTLLVGSFITTIVNFVIVGAVMFIIVKAYNKLSKPADGGDAVTEIGLLTEIRDSLQK